MPTRFGKFITGKHFSKIFLLLYILFMCFAAHKTDKALCLLTNQPHLYGIVYIIFAVVALLIMMKKSISRKWPNRSFKKIFSFLSCFFIYYLLTLLAWELICVIIRPAETIKAIGIIGAVFTAILIVVYGYLHTKIIKVKPYHIALGGGKEGYRIVLISDVHLGVFVGKKHVQRIVSKINELEPDLLVISGDIFDVDNSLLERPDELRKISKEFRKIKSKEGVYAVVGNHDPEISNKAFEHFLKAAKIRLLDNDAKMLSKINIVGRTDEVNNERTELLDVISKVEAQKPIIVLDHKPENIADAVKHGADLVLCGHTHRGQMFPITVFTKWANGKKCFYGHHITGKTHSIITSGVGFFELPMRLGTSNEIVDIHLQV